MSMLPNPNGISVDTTGEPSRTKQSFKDECDINKIMAKFKTTGLISHLAKGVPTYADVSEVSDFRSAVDIVKQAEDYFMTLPAEVREAFDNDAATYADWVAHPDNDVRKLKALGLELLDGDPSDDAAAKAAAGLSKAKQSSPEGSGPPNPPEG